MRVTLIIFTLIACNGSPGLSVKEELDIAAAVRETLYQYNNDVRRAGLHSEFAYLDSSSSFSWVPPGFTHPLSYDSVTYFIRQAAQTVQRVENNWMNLRITPLTGHLASYAGNITSIVTNMQGASDTLQLIETGVMIKRSGGWKLLQGQTALLNNR